MEIVKVQQPTKMPTMETLLQCSNGLAKKMKKERTKLKRDRLKDIKDEIDFLIEAL